MKKYYTFLFIGGIIYILLSVTSIFTIDLIDNSGDITDPFSNNSDKMLIINKSETYHLNKGDIPLILVSTFAAPLNILVETITVLSDPIESFYIKGMNIFGLVLLFVSYIILPLSWIVYSVALFKKNKIILISTRKMFPIITAKFVPISIFILVSFFMSFFWVRLIFENFKGFF